MRFVEELLKGQTTLFPSNEELIMAWPEAKENTRRTVSLIHVGIEKGALDVSRLGASLNDAVPHLKALKTEEYLSMCFSGKKLA